MKRSIEFFRFTLGNGQSISPMALRKLWADACQTPNVSVARQGTSFNSGGKAVYSLYADPGLPNLAQVEQRLRLRMEQAHLRRSLIALHA
jgi:hypothetical protein